MKVLTERVKETQPPGTKFDFEAELEKLNAMSDEEFREKYAKW